MSQADNRTVQQRVNDWMKAHPDDNVAQCRNALNKANPKTVDSAYNRYKRRLNKDPNKASKAPAAKRASKKKKKPGVLPIVTEEYEELVEYMRYANMKGVRVSFGEIVSWKDKTRQLKVVDNIPEETESDEDRVNLQNAARKFKEVIEIKSD